jgi:hypothetical protein
MSNFINTIDLLGDSVVFDALIEGTLEEFNDDIITKVSNLGFRENKGLKYVNLPHCKTIGANAFESTSLKMLILSSETMCTLSNTSAFNSTPIKSGTGYIYVPRALVDTYKTATNWSTYANQFRALEDYTVDGTVTGELDESKI